MTKYGKIVGGALRVPKNYPCFITVNGSKINNPTEEQLKCAGYLPIVEKEPSCSEGKIPQASYRIDADRIVQEWSYIDIEQDDYHTDTI